MFLTGSGLSAILRIFLTLMYAGHCGLYEDNTVMIMKRLPHTSIYKGLSSTVEIDRESMQGLRLSIGQL
jgi:hypothetical protein